MTVIDCCPPAIETGFFELVIDTPCRTNFNVLEKGNPIFNSILNIFNYPSEIKIKKSANFELPKGERPKAIPMATAMSDSFIFNLLIDIID